MYTSVNLVLQLEGRKKNNMSRLLSEESYQVFTVILQGANMGKLIDPEFTRCRDALKSKLKKGRGNKPNATTALSEEKIDNN